MATHNSMFKLVIKNIVLVKPSQPIPSSILSLSSFDNRPDLDDVVKTVSVYQPTNHDSCFGQSDLALVFKEALSKTLLYYYPLAGRLVKYADEDYKIHFNSADCGVPFLEAVADCHLSSIHYLDGIDREIAKHFAIDLPLEDENGHQYPFMFKVTRFPCGGFIIGMAISHRLCDGFGAFQLSKAINELARGNSEPYVKPVWERERLVGSKTKLPFQDLMDVASAAISPFEPSTVLVHECFKVDQESIRRVKMRLMKESGNETMMEKSVTTFEALAACVWRSRARALQLNHEGKTILILTMGMRGHLDPPLPDGYYGNAISEAYVTLTVKELNEKPLLEVMKAIRETKEAALNVEHIKNKIDTTFPSLEYFNNFGFAFLSMTDWRHLGVMENQDYEGSKLVNAIPIPDNESMFECIITPPCKLEPSMKGGARLFLSLPSAAMIKFRQEMEVLGFSNHLHESA
ncbi:hypothetical protein RIF29_28512 [Crotalaria pallida]|uniref:Uncharacterized protein n=1 Tax=Crotalaria pallida TaxID=3830 RepID=A0AAN9EDT6_CROPI